MKRAYRDGLHLSKKNIAKLAEVNAIIEEYAAQGYALTLRQLYYQLVSRDMIPNKKAEYDKLGKLLTKGRMGGVVDWDAIEDRIRVPKIPYEVDDIADALNDTVRQYRLNRQRGQQNYIEAWCEKDALSNVLFRVTKEYHIRLLINRGYTSTTAIYDAAQRFQKAHNRGCSKFTILYIGDHDPSGLDMLRDIEDRLIGFSCMLDIVPVALTREQIEEHDPPENPAKISDPRAAWYINEHGYSSWEVDALPPQVLHELLTEAIEERINMAFFEEIKKEEAQDIHHLELMIEQMQD